MKKLILLILSILLLCGCQTEDSGELGNGLQLIDRMELDYATQFSVDYYQGGYKLLSLGNGSRYLTVPEGADCPKGLSKDIVILQQPVENIYLAATSAMCLFDSMERLDAITLSGTQADGWYIDNARKAMEQGEILYAGKYSQPDYELILGEGCQLAVESTMISHKPEVEEKLVELGIPVLIDQSSLESHPLGRTEWIKFYAALLNEEEKAQSLFEEQSSHLKKLIGLEPTGNTVAFFHVSSSGFVVTRKTGDYVSKMLELAGGDYIFDDLGDPEKATSTVTIDMESFYATAKDADYIIYNSTIGGEVHSLEELLEKNKLFSDFKAVQEGNVWCTGQNMFQETMKLGQMIGDFHEMLCGTENNQLEYIYRLQ